MPPRTRALFLLLGATLMLGACRAGPAQGVSPAPSAPEPVTWGEIAALPLPPADHRIEYGPDPLHFGELRLPSGAGPHPVAVIIHGGCWRAEYDLRHITHLSAALTRAGVATWTLEFRRIGNPGGGWTGTFEDVVHGVEQLRTLAPDFNLDLDRVALVGHSAGGHLALWLAGRRNLPGDEPLGSPPTLPLRGVVALAGITDLRDYAGGAGNCNAAVPELLGGTPDDVPQRYALASPIELLPAGVPLRLVHGDGDPTVPTRQSRDFAARARSLGDDAELVLIPGAGHFDVIAPFAAAWPRVEAVVLSLLAPR
jgi:acetyl esterase/lipase